MKNSKAIVTIALGKKHLGNWKRHCEANWRLYAEKHGFDLICFEQPLDTTDRAQRRSPAWQKCLILGAEAVKGYHQVVWVDCDILINHHTSPDITRDVPEDKVGGAEDIGFSQTEPLAAARFLNRVFEYWPNAVINRSAREFYGQYGLTESCDRVLNTGVVVLSPRHHRELLERVYRDYEEKGGREWLMEMRPLSYEIVRSGRVHWIDPRFNLMWPYLEMVHYPFLLPQLAQPQHRSLRSRIKDKLKWILSQNRTDKVRRLCLNSAFHSAFFLHLGGMNMEDLGTINDLAKSWMDFLS